MFRGGDNQIRTDDPLLAKQVLSQLSYTPTSLPAQFTPFPLLSVNSAPIRRRSFSNPNPLRWASYLLKLKISLPT